MQFISEHELEVRCKRPTVKWNNVFIFTILKSKFRIFVGWNSGPSDFESTTLPAEVIRRLVIIWSSNGSPYLVLCNTCLHWKRKNKLRNWLLSHLSRIMSFNVITRPFLFRHDPHRHVLLNNQCHASHNEVVCGWLNLWKGYFQTSCIWLVVFCWKINLTGRMCSRKINHCSDVRPSCSGHARCQSC